MPELSRVTSFFLFSVSEIRCTICSTLSVGLPEEEEEEERKLESFYYQKQRYRLRSWQ